MLMICKKQKEIDVIKFTNNFTSLDAEKIRSEMDYIICRGSSKLLIDLSEVKAIGLGALNLLYICALKTKKRNGGLVICKPQEEALKALGKAKFRHCFKLFSSKKLAIRSLNQEASI
jgi:anti-anti-sigma regulatory factor